MTKRDKQASEYAAESYGKTYRKRCVSHMSWAFTDEEREAIKSAAMSLDGTHSLDYARRARQAATLRKLLERTK